MSPWPHTCHHSWRKRYADADADRISESDSVRSLIVPTIHDVSVMRTRTEFLRRPLVPKGKAGLSPIAFCSRILAFVNRNGFTCRFLLYIQFTCDGGELTKQLRHSLINTYELFNWLKCDSIKVNVVFLKGAFACWFYEKRIYAAWKGCHHFTWVFPQLPTT